MSKTSLLIVDDEPAIVAIFERLAKQQKWSYAVATNGYEALDYLSKNEVECVVLDLHLPSHSGFQILEHLKSSHNPAEVMVITGSGSVDHAVQALKLGAFDYLTKPFEDLSRVIHNIEKALERYRLVKKVEELQQPQEDLSQFEQLVGKSRAMQDVYQLILSLKDSSATVLIQGESGTGKEMVAQALHRTSPRAHKPFKVINCAAIPENLLESELFGHVKGAFTGAVCDKSGLFAEAHEGTLFLDEIGEVSPAFQVKLLRVLQNGEYKRVGDAKNRYTDVRIISATNQDLKELIRQGKFREDLYYRLHVIGIHLPPLRDRKEDIPLLAYHFLKKYNEKMHKQIAEISFDAMQAMQAYTWIGNVRELENVMERGMVLAPGDSIRAKDLPANLLAKSFYLEETEELNFSNLSYQEAKQRALEAFNKSYLQQLLKQTEGNITNASEMAGMDRSNFKKIIRKFGVTVQEFRRNSK